MKVSIITATYNSSDTIIDTVRSVESQTYQNIEYIVIDGGSSDKTLKVVETNSTRVSRILSESDNGIYDALNKGIDCATGDIVGFLHSDDIFASETVIEDIVKEFGTSKTDAVYGDLEYVSKIDLFEVVRLWKSGDYAVEKLKRGWMPPHPTFYMRRDLYKKYGSFDLSFKIAGDYDSLLRYLWRYKISMAYIPKVLLKMRVGGASNRSLKNIIQKTKEDIKALKNSGVPVLRAIVIKNLSKIPQFLYK